ncbi:F-box only protein 31 [Terramyces sp. JEL0728]|nr:F-box only protein 31 [Terramyces sp. JEL0728]
MGNQYCNQTANDNTLWFSHCKNILQHHDESLKYLCQIKTAVFQKTHFYKSFKQLYIVLHKYGKFLGLWHPDYSFFIGGLIRVRLNYHNENQFVLVGERIICPYAEMEDIHSFSLDDRINIHVEHDTNYQTSKIFGVIMQDYKLKTLCLEGAHKGAHSASIQIPIIPENDLPALLSGISITERIKSQSFPLGPPNAISGLWSFPVNSIGSEQTLFGSSFNIDQNTAPSIYIIECEKKCHHKRIRGVGFSNDAHQISEVTEYIPKLSKIALPNTNITVDNVKMPKPGVWMGAYGSHGNELLFVSYAVENDMRKLIVTKITGDVNVPRGEVSFSATLNNSKYTLGNTSHNINNSSEFKNGIVFDGVGTVAMEGYQSPTKIPCDGIPNLNIVIVVSDTQFSVYWYGLEQSGDGWVSSFTYFKDIH